MTNEEMLLKALMGEEIPEGTTFHPQTNKQAYLAYAVGLITDPSLLPPPRTNEEVLLREYCLNGGGGSGEGGIVLPTLANPADAYHILSGYEALDGDGKMLVGIMKDNSGKVMQVAVDLDRGVVMVPEGYHDGFTGLEIDIEEQTVTPGDEEQEIVPSDGAVLGKVVVKAAPAGDDFAITDASYFFYEGNRLNQAAKYYARIKNCTNFTGLFSGNTQSENIDLTGLNTTGGLYFGLLFRGCTKIKTVDTTTLDTSAAHQVRNMFEGCTSLEEADVTGLVGPTVGMMTSVFKNCSKLTSLDLSSWDVSGAGGTLGTESLFDGCSALESVNLTGWRLLKADKLNNMFYKCSSLKSLDLSDVTTSEELEELKYMFYLCSALESLVFGEGFNTSNVNTMDSMFYGCSALTDLDLSMFDTKNVTKMSTMFQNCKQLTSLDLSQFNTGKVTTMRQMFYGCSGLQELDISDWDTSKVTDMYQMFHGCTALKRFDMSGWDTGAVTNAQNMFYNCGALEEITGFSATNKAGLTIGFPSGSSTTPKALKRLTFRTDLPEGQYAIRSAIYIPHCSFTREGMAEMFNSLPDLTNAGSISNSYKTITITGNPCVTGYVYLPEKSVQFDTLETYEDFLAAADEFYGDHDRTGATITAYLTDASPSNQTVNLSDYDEAMFARTYSSIKFNAFQAPIPDTDLLTDEDRAIATQKGWTLVE